MTFITAREIKIIDDEYSDLVAAIHNKISIEFKLLQNALNLKYKSPMILNPIHLKEMILESLKISKDQLKVKLSLGLIKA